MFDLFYMWLEYMLPVTVSHKFGIVDPMWVQMVKINKVETLAYNIPLNMNIVFILTLYMEHWTLWTICNLWWEG